MNTKLVSFLVVIVVMTMMACGGDSPSSTTSPDPTPTPTTATTPPPAPTNAVITLTGSFECTDSFCDDATFDLTLRNTGGVGANLNFVRIENRNRQAILELGADHFNNAFGNNRLEAGATLDFVLTGPLGFVVIVGYRDDNRNSGEVEYFPDLPR